MPNPRLCRRHTRAVSLLLPVVLCGTWQVRFTPVAFDAELFEDAMELPIIKGGKATEYVTSHLYHHIHTAPHPPHTHDAYHNHPVSPCINASRAPPALRPRPCTMRAPSSLGWVVTLAVCPCSLFLWHGLCRYGEGMIIVHSLVRLGSSMHCSRSVPSHCPSLRSARDGWNRGGGCVCVCGKGRDLRVHAA